jgi:hypothetical protein
MGKGEQKRHAKTQAIANAGERRRVVLRVYQGCEAAGAQKLAELATSGVVPSCAVGCSHCCSLEVPVSRPEGETLVAWLVEQRAPEELDAIRARLRGWLDWYRTDYPRLLASGMTRVDAFFRHGPPCALLEDGRCGAYPVRPVTCRNHYVSSPASVCDPAVGNGEPDVMLAVAAATYDHVAEIRRIVEQQGGNYLASVHLLPEWLGHLLGVELEPWRGAPPAV